MGAALSGAKKSLLPLTPLTVAVCRTEVVTFFRFLPLADAAAVV
jgi:hypothetical protein